MNNNRLDLHILLMWIIGLLLFWVERLPSDWMTACLFSLALLFLLQGKILAYALLFPIICLNRETSFLLVIFYLLYDHEIHMGRDIAMMLYQVFIWFAVRLSLMYVFHNNGGLDMWFMPFHNLQAFITHPLHTLLHLVIAGVILFFVFKNWLSKPYNLRLAFCVFAPILIVAYWIVGQPYETRVLFEAYPVMAILAYKGIMQI